MAKLSIRDRVMKAEHKQRFLDWLVKSRFYESFTADELETFAGEGKLPDPLPNRPSRLDGLDLKSLVKRWEEDERVFGGRSHEELQFFTDNGSWPEQRGRLLYSIQGGKLFVEWQNDIEQASVSPRTTAQEQGT